MAKKILAIDLDEVIRSKWIQFDRFYAQEFGEDGIKMPFDTYDLRNHYEFNDTTEQINLFNEDLPEDISPREYIVDKETGVAPVDFMAFRKREETATADETYNKFLYEDFVIEIFGSAPPLYRGLDIDLRRFKELYKEEVEVILFSVGREESISPTLFFLSKIRPNIKKYLFLDNGSEIWNEVGTNGIVITTDPSIVVSKGAEQKVVVLTRPHNMSITGADYTGMNLQDFFKVKEDKNEKIVTADEKFKAFLN